MEYTSATAKVLLDAGALPPGSVVRWEQVLEVGDPVVVLHDADRPQAWFTPPEGLESLDFQAVVTSPAGQVVRRYEVKPARLGRSLDVKRAEYRIDKGEIRLAGTAPAGATVTLRLGTDAVVVTDVAQCWRDAGTAVTVATANGAGQWQYRARGVPIPPGVTAVTATVQDAQGLLCERVSLEFDD